MVDRLRVSLYGMMFFAFLALTGCPPPATTKPEAPPPAPPQPTARESAPAGRAAPSPSSLEAARRGTTPAPSPLNDIYFDFDKYDLKTEARGTLKANAGWLKANPAARVEIEGHCDERGTNEYNLALGAKRAQAAKDYLVTLGISKERLSTISYGEELPVCKEQNEGCWQKNRRARFVIVSAKPAS
ncbi:MAG: peptidoglycan-associated lipoprotein Pal [Deltaproteobacteria bacterium]|nr:peptidoglycan-associated lipoprotein Pal [Deltaproteobacteria bacterium]